MVRLCWGSHKTAILAFLLIIIKDETTFSGRTKSSVSAYQQFFRVRPTDHQVVQGSDLVLQCQVANQAGLVQWSKDGFALGFDPDVPGWPRYSMIVDRQRGVYNLKIEDIQLTDEGELECQVGPTDDNRAIRSNARITVLVPPGELFLTSTSKAITNTTKQKGSHSSTLRVREAQRITLVCNTSSPSRPATQIKWFRNGVPLTRESHSTQLREGLGALGKLSLTTTAINIYAKLDDNGVKYSCQGEHPALTKPVKSSITLSILYPPGPPSIEGYTSGDAISAGDTLHLACISSGGNPLAKLIWYKESHEVDSTYSSGGGRETTNVYTFTVRADDNNAVYKCEASNDVTTQPLIAFTKLRVLFPAVRVEISGQRQARMSDVVSVVCVAGPANPSAQITWEIDGESVTPGISETTETKEGWMTSANLTFTITGPAVHSKLISCFASSDSLGQTIVQTFNIDILYPPGVPYIMGYQEGTDLTAGELYRFKCVSMGGNPLPTLRWQAMTVGSDAALDRHISALNSITGSGVSSELVIRAQPSDNGATYRCEASNPATTTPLTASIKLSVFYITDMPAIKSNDRYAKSGDQMDLTCDSGPCHPTCQLFWYKNEFRITGHNDEVTDMDFPFGAKNSRNRISLNVSAEDDQSVLECRAFQPVIKKSITSNITLNILFKPEFMAPPLQKLDVREGSDMSVNLSARGNPSDISYVWWKDSLPLFDISDTTTTEISNALINVRSNQRSHQLIIEGPVLTIREVLREDSGQYDCQASNGQGSSRVTIIINVLFGPTIVDKSKTVSVDAGDSVSLFCSAEANPMPDHMIQWTQHQFTDFLTDSRIRVTNERGKSTLEISNINSERDGGHYECHAYNGIGEEVVESVVVLIKSRPEIISNMTSKIIAGDLSESVTLECTAFGVPEVRFKWISPDGHDIDRRDHKLSANSVGSDTQYSAYSLQTKPISDTVFQSSLTIKRITDRELNKSFKCVALNQKGETQTDIKLRRRGRPDPPTDIKLINITHNTAFLTWAPGFDGGHSQAFRVKYRKIKDHDQDQQFRETESNWIAIIKLEANSHYRFVVCAVNGFGESESPVGSDHALEAWTLTTEADSSEALSDGLNAQNANPNDKSLSTIIMIIVFVLGLLLIILNASLVVCYLKWKRQVDTGNKTKSKGNKSKLNKFKDNGNGTAILMKAFSQDDLNFTPSLVSEPSTKRCEVLVMTDMHSASSAQPVAVLLTNYDNQRLHETSDCPDVIKAPLIDRNESNSTDCQDLTLQQINTFCNNRDGMNKSNANKSSMIYGENKAIQSPNCDRLQLKSILKNGTIKSQQIHRL